MPAFSPSFPAAGFTLLTAFILTGAASALPTRVPVVPVALIQGRLTLPEGQALPGSLQAALKAVPAGRVAEALTVGCSVREGRFACPAPAGRFDIRLRAEGCVSHFRWDVDLPAWKPLDWGTVELAPGASIAGWVEAEGGRPLGPDCRVTAVPFGAEITAPSAGRAGAVASLSAPVNERGFFHLDGVAPGRYSVTAAQSGFAPADATVQVLAGREADLIQPLILSLPLEVEISVTPPLDPTGDTWTLQLSRRAPGFKQVKELGRRSVPPAGLLRWPGLSRGTYLVSVIRPDGTPWHREEIAVDGDGAPVALRLDLVEVEGTVTLGGEPVGAALMFGGTFGDSRQRFDADEAGEFSGLLPRAGDWPVEVKAAEPDIEVFLPRVEVRPLKGETRARVEIALPDTRLRGRVVDERRRPVSTALLDVTPSGDPGNRGMQKLVGPDGEFEIRGLPEGLAVIEATGREGKSDQMSVLLKEGTDPQVLELVIRKLRRVDGRVLAPSGAVPGATLLFGPAQQEVPAMHFRFTGPEGEFWLEVPEGTREVVYWVSAPGFAFRFGRMPLPAPGQPLTVRVDQQGGTLDLDLSPPGSDPSAGFFVLAHQGGVVSGPWIDNWGTIHGGARRAADRLTWDGMEPGLYSLCRASTATFPALQATGFQGASCVAGVLEPAGDLTLSIPPAL